MHYMHIKVALQGIFPELKNPFDIERSLNGCLVSTLQVLLHKKQFKAVFAEKFFEKEKMNKNSKENNFKKSQAVQFNQY